MITGPATAVGPADSARVLSKSALDREVGTFASEAEVLAAESTLASRPLLAALILVAWMGVGLLGAVIMARRGHDFRPLAGLAVVLGPLFAGFVAANLRPRERGAHAQVVRPPVDLGGTERVSVLFLGDGSAMTAARSFIAESVSDPKYVDIVHPINYETADGSGEPSDRDLAERNLHAAGDTLAEFQPGLTLFPGTTPRSISEHIDDAAPDLVLIVGDPTLETKLDHRTGQGVRVLSVPDSGIR